MGSADAWLLLTKTRTLSSLVASFSLEKVVEVVSGGVSRDVAERSCNHIHN